MATPTAPTLVLPAQEPAPAPVAPSGPLAAILNPVEPARPVQTIGSTARLAEESAGAAPTAERSGKASAQGARQDGPFGALIRAFAARIGRTGTQHTVKRQHTITEQRATGNQNTNAGRVNRNSDHRHSGQNHTQHQTARNQKLEDLRNKAQQRQDRSNRDAKTADTRGATHARTARDGRDVKDSRDTKTSDTTTARWGDTTKPSQDPKATGGPGQKSTPVGPTAPKDTATGKPATAKPDGNADAKPVSLDKAPGAPTGSTRPRTQSSREAGYHDGRLGGAVVGHVQAWKDGVADGYADRTAENEAERRRMDQAKARNARQPQQPKAPAMQPVSGSTVDLQKKTPTPATAQPVIVTGISASHVTFADPSGAVTTMGRGEVRTLKAFETRMSAKVPAMNKVAEDCKVTRQQATDLAVRAQRLAEQARGVDGGERLIRKLLRLAEEVQGLRAKTEGMEKAAVRGAEAVRAVVANAHTRHGGIYRAVVDSPLTKPAERAFYTDGQGS